MRTAACSPSAVSQAVGSAHSSCAQPDRRPRECSGCCCRQWLQAWWEPAPTTSSTDHERYRGKPLDAFKLWNGGLGIYGGLAAGLVWARCSRTAPSCLSRHCSTPAAVALPIAQAVGRLGNYTNQELYGRPTDLPLGLQIDPRAPTRGVARPQQLPPDLPVRGRGQRRARRRALRPVEGLAGSPHRHHAPPLRDGLRCDPFSGWRDWRIDDFRGSSGLRTNQWMSLESSPPARSAPRSSLDGDVHRAPDEPAVPRDRLGGTADRGCGERREWSDVDFRIARSSCPRPRSHGAPAVDDGPAKTRRSSGTTSPACSGASTSSRTL